MKTQVVLTFDSWAEAQAWAYVHAQPKVEANPKTPPLSELNLSAHAFTALANAGINSTTALLQKSRRELQRLPGLGQLSLKSIDRALAANKLNLKADR